MLICRNSSTIYWKRQRPFEFVFTLPWIFAQVLVESSRLQVLIGHVVVSRCRVIIRQKGAIEEIQKLPNLMFTAPSIQLERHCKQKTFRLIFNHRHHPVASDWPRRFSFSLDSQGLALADTYFVQFLNFRSFEREDTKDDNVCVVPCQNFDFELLSRVIFHDSLLVETLDNFRCTPKGLEQRLKGLQYHTYDAKTECNLFLCPIVFHF